MKPSSSGTAGACGFFKLFVCSLGKVSSCVGGGGGDKGAKVGVGFSSIGGDGGGGVPITEKNITGMYLMNNITSLSIIIFNNILKSDWL